MIGIFGGRFDPIHRAHLAMAQAAADQLQLQEVLWVVSANAVHKSIVASAEHRLEMVRLVLEELKDPRMKLDTREIHAAERGEDNPSYKTLQSLKQERPDAQWVWIMGEDQLQAFTTWQRWEWLTQNMALAVCRRPSVLPTDGTTDLESPPKLIEVGARVFTVDFQADTVSSSLVRSHIARGLPIQTLVPQSVANYLSGNALAQTLYSRAMEAGAEPHPNSV